MNQLVLRQQPSEANSLKLLDLPIGLSRAIYTTRRHPMTAKLAFERPVTIGALTAIAEGVMPNPSSSPISLIWTLLRRMLRKG
jgi:hypothetical protein